MKYCCPVFEGAIGEAGNRGLAVIIDQSASGSPEFILQHRAVDLGTPPPDGYPGPIVLVNDTRIAFCPWCGRRLKSFYGSYADELRRPGLRVALPDPLES